MKKIELVVFDMAGTTVDEDNVVYKTVQKVINDAGFNVTLDEVLLHGAGKEKHQAIMDVLRMCTAEKNIEAVSNKLFSNFKVALKQAYDNLKITTFEGTEEVFKMIQAHGAKVVLNTGYNKTTALQLLKELNWNVGETIDGLVTADDVVNGRPSGDMILKAMEQHGVTNALHVVKIGDSAIDVEEGKDAGCGLTIGVLTGAQNREEIQKAHPDYILNSLKELEKIF